MGKTTSNAVAAHESFAAAHSLGDKAMSGSIAVLDVKNNKYFQFAKKYEQQPGADHVEEVLLRKMTHHFGNVDNIPNGAKIVLLCNWSPCSSCTENTIPIFMNLIAARNACIQVKFRYRYLYTHDRFSEAWRQAGKQMHAWNSDGNARSTYENLSLRFGNITVFRARAIDLQEGTKILAVDEKSRRMLFIGELDAKSGSELVDTSEFHGSYL